MKVLKLNILFILCFLNGSFAFAQQYGLIIADNVNVREESSSKSRSVGKIINELTFVMIEDESIQEETIEVGISSMKYTWYQINQDNKLKGWVYGAYIIVFNSPDSVMECVMQNTLFRSKHTGKYTFTDISQYFAPYYELELFADGKVTISSNCVEGDHILEEKGEGRYYINTSNSTFNVYGNMIGEFAPDFYSWEEYFELANGHKPSKKELDEYIKKMSHYKSRCSFSIPLDKLDEMLIPSKQ